MAQIKEGSIIKKVAGDEVIATVVDVSTKVDKVTDKSLVADTEITKLNEITGTNTGDQDLSNKVDKVSGKSLIADTGITKVDFITVTQPVNLDTMESDIDLKAPIESPTFTGIVTGNNNTSYTTSQLRNARIYADGATVPTLADGEIAFIYEV